MKAELLSTFGDDLMVVNAARVSMAKHHDVFDKDTDTRLIKYLAKHNHIMPFAHPKAQFRLHLPIFVARQWEKHRIGAVRGYDGYDQSEVSRRYVDDCPEFWEPKAWRTRPEGSIKQGSGGGVPEYFQAPLTAILHDAHNAAVNTYAYLLAHDVAPEQARAVLPQSTYTQWIETGSLLYWSRLCGLRLDAHAQQEIRELATQVDQQMAEKFPVAWAALRRAGRSDT